jgi:sulfur carrier protein
MTLSINGERKTFKGDTLTIQELLEKMAYGKGIAVALNETFVMKTKYSETKIKDGDRIDILSPVQGG